MCHVVICKNRFNRAVTMSDKKQVNELYDRPALIKRLTLVLQLCCLAAGSIVYHAIGSDAAGPIWSVAAIAAFLLMIAEMVPKALRGNIALDVIASLPSLPFSPRWYSSKHSLASSLQPCILAGSGLKTLRGVACSAT
jgi:hypothetical protein